VGHQRGDGGHQTERVILSRGRFPDRVTRLRRCKKSPKMLPSPSGDYLIWKVDYVTNQITKPDYRTKRFWPLFSTVNTHSLSTKNGLGHTLGDFLTNTTGHPDLLV
jgi:hypothetical protein